MWRGQYCAKLLLAAVTAGLCGVSACRTDLHRRCGCADGGAYAPTAIADSLGPEFSPRSDVAVAGPDVARDAARDRSSDRMAQLVPAQLPEYCTPDGWSGADIAFSAVWGFAADDLWVAASELGNHPTASVLLHYDGSDWTAFSGYQKAEERALESDLEALWGIASDDIWAGGSNGYLFHWDGRAWTYSSCLGGYTVRGIHGRARDDVWAVADEGIVYHWNGAKWQYVVSSTRTDLFGVWASGANDAWAVGRGGLVLHWDGNAWAPYTDVYGGAPTLADLHAIWGSAADDVWAVGAEGVVLHFDGSQWAVASRVPPTTRDLHAVWADGPDNLWAAGAGGALIHWNGAAWFAVAVETPQALLAVWGSPAGDLWAVGERALATHWDGAAWATTPPRPLNEHLLAVAARSPNDVWATGVHGTVAHWDGKAWQQRSFGDVTLRAIWYRPSEHLWIVGSGGTVLECSSGISCMQRGSDTSSELEAIWGTAYNDLWVGGAGGLLRHLRGSTWETVAVPTTADLRSIWGVAADDLWIATRSEVVLHWDGSDWSSFSVSGGGNAGTAWRLVFGAVSDDVWLTGTSAWGAYKAGGVMPAAGRWNGQAWSSADLGYISAAAVISAAEIWVVSPGLYGYGDPGTSAAENQTGVGRWNGSEWSGSLTGSRKTLNGISASSPDDIWVVGAQGTVLRRRR